MTTLFRFTQSLHPLKYFNLNMPVLHHPISIMTLLNLIIFEFKGDRSLSAMSMCVVFPFFGCPILIYPGFNLCEHFQFSIVLKVTNLWGLHQRRIILELNKTFYTFSESAWNLELDKVIWDRVSIEFSTLNAQTRFVCDNYCNNG